MGTNRFSRAQTTPKIVGTQAIDIAQKADEAKNPVGIAENH